MIAGPKKTLFVSRTGPGHMVSEPQPSATRRTTQVAFQGRRGFWVDARGQRRHTHPYLSPPDPSSVWLNSLCTRSFKAIMVIRRISRPALLRFLLPLLGVLLAVALTACRAQDAASTAEDGVLWDPMLTETEVCRNFNLLILACVHCYYRHMDTDMKYVSFLLPPMSR